MAKKQRRRRPPALHTDEGIRRFIGKPPKTKQELRLATLHRKARHHANAFEDSLVDIYDQMPGMAKCIAEMMVAVVLYTEGVVKREMRERALRKAAERHG